MRRVSIYQFIAGDGNLDQTALDLHTGGDRIR